jgi:hypothetical protein
MTCTAMLLSVPNELGLNSAGLRAGAKDESLGVGVTTSLVGLVFSYGNSVYERRRGASGSFNLSTHTQVQTLHRCAANEMHASTSPSQKLVTPGNRIFTTMTVHREPEIYILSTI